MLPGFPNPGDLVRFSPPETAYTPRSAQAQVQGQVGVIYAAYNDSYAWVLFHRALVLVNTAYLELETAEAKPRGGRAPSYYRRKSL